MAVITNHLLNRGGTIAGCVGVIAGVLTFFLDDWNGWALGAAVWAALFALENHREPQELRYAKLGRKIMYAMNRSADGRVTIEGYRVDGYNPRLHD